VARPMLSVNARAHNDRRRRVDAMPMETLLTLVIALGVPLWLAAEEILHWFPDKQSRVQAVEPKVAAAPTKANARRPLETSSHIA
jgi:hypothetical protein